MLVLKRFQQFLILIILFFLPFYFIKFKYGWISLNLVEILILALVIIWFFKKLGNRGDWVNWGSWRKYWLPIILILIGIASSLLVNKNYYVGLGILKGWFVLPIIFALIFYDNLKRDKKLLDWSLAALFCSGVFVSIEGIYYWISGLLTYDGRLTIFYDSPNQLAMFLAPIFLIGLYKVRPWGIPRREVGEGKGRTLKSSWKLLLTTVGIILISLNLFLTKSYGAWLAIGLTLIAILWLKYREIWSKKYLFIMIIILIILAGIAGFGKFENIKNLGNRSSLASREIIWKSAGLMIQKNPVFGIGPGNFQNKYLEYQKYFPPYPEWAVPQPHNLFLAFWLEAGIVGFAGFILLLAQFFRDNKKAIENNRLYGTLCLVIMLYFLIHGLVDTTYWRNDLSTMFWVIIAVNFYLAGSLGSALRRSG